jgi:hypothetical protein
MMCQRIGIPPISTNGFGTMVVSSLSLVPKPPASITAFMIHLLRDSPAQPLVSRPVDARIDVVIQIFIIT